LVDQLTIQTVGVLVAASSVVLYLLNLFMANRREERNKKVALSQTFLQSLLSAESSKNWAEMLNAKWDSFEDFMRKYDSTVNPEFFGKRWTFFNTFDLLGYLMRKDLVDKETVLKGGGYLSIYMWAKYKPVIDEYRKIAYPRNMYSDFEYLAHEMRREIRLGDPDFVTDKTHFSDDVLVRTFGADPR